MRLEDLPRIFIRNPLSRELQQALTDFQAEREYRGVDPFAHRFDQILADNPVTEIFVSLPMSEIVHRFHGIDARTIDPYREFLLPYREMIESDRKVGPPKRRDHFRQVVQRNLQQHGLETSQLEEFADWIFEDTKRCPTQHLLNGIHWSLVKNSEEKLEGNLLADIIHALSANYVDLITLDATMRGHILRSDPALEGRVCRDLREVLERIRPVSG